MPSPNQRCALMELAGISEQLTSHQGTNHRQIGREILRINPVNFHDEIDSSPAEETH